MHQQRAAEAEYDFAAAEYRKTVLAAFEDVADTLRALQSDATALASRASAEDAASQSLALAHDQFNSGATNYIDLLNAEQTEQQTRVALVQARAARFTDTAALFQALGGGWWNRQSDITKAVPEEQTTTQTDAANPPAQTLQSWRR